MASFEFSGIFVIRWDSKGVWISRGFRRYEKLQSLIILVTLQVCMHSCINIEVLGSLSTINHRGLARFWGYWGYWEISRHKWIFDELSYVGYFFIDHIHRDILEIYTRLHKNKEQLMKIMSLNIIYSFET